MKFEIKQDNITPDKKLIRKHWKKIKKLLKKDKRNVSFYIPGIKSETLELFEKYFLEIEIPQIRELTKIYDHFIEELKNHGKLEKNNAPPLKILKNK